MKKLMFAAAVAAGLVAFGDGIESANTVGYQQKAVRQFLSQQVCTFDAVGGGGLDLQKLIPVDANGDYIGDGDINVQFYNEYGLIQSAFAYYGDDEYDDDCPAGWYNEETDERVTFTFDPGQGFYVSAASACISGTTPDRPASKQQSPQPLSWRRWNTARLHNRNGNR